MTYLYFSLGQFGCLNCGS